jgi:hypothetical protein
MTATLFDPHAMLDLLQEHSGEAVTNREAVSTVLTHVYHASLYKEESREVRCRVLLIDDAADGYLDLLPFASPVPLNAASLRRLSVGAVEPDSVIVVTCGGNTPAIAGYATPTALMTYFEVLGIRARPYEIGCLSPGVVEVSANDTTVRFARDKYVTPVLRAMVPVVIPAHSPQVLVHRLLRSEARGRIAQSRGRSAGPIDADALEHEPQTLASEAAWAAAWTLEQYAASLVQQIRAIGVGGSLLVLPATDADPWQHLMSGHVIGNAHERYADELWNAGLYSSFEWLLHLRMAHLGRLLVRRADRLRPEEWIAHEGTQGFIDATELTRADARRVARLTALDGALVVNDVLRPVAFGAKFKQVDTAGLPVAVRAAIETRGMRHRALAATVAAIPNAGGVVVSQDGDVTLFANTNGVVCCHQEEQHARDETLAACGHAGSRAGIRAPEWLTDILTDGELAKHVGALRR